MKYPLFTDMALTRDVPAHGLMRGDVVRLVEHHVSPDGVEGYSVEVLNAVGDTVVITAVAAAALDHCAVTKCWRYATLGHAPRSLFDASTP